MLYTSRIIPSLQLDKEQFGGGGGSGEKSRSESATQSLHDSPRVPPELLNQFSSNSPLNQIFRELMEDDVREAVTEMCASITQVGQSSTQQIFSFLKLEIECVAVGADASKQLVFEGTLKRLVEGHWVDVPGKDGAGKIKKMADRFPHAIVEGVDWQSYTGDWLESLRSRDGVELEHVASQKLERALKIGVPKQATKDSILTQLETQASWATDIETHLMRQRKLGTDETDDAEAHQTELRAILGECAAYGARMCEVQREIFAAVRPDLVKQTVIQIAEGVLEATEEYASSHGITLQRDQHSVEYLSSAGKVDKHAFHTQVAHQMRFRMDSREFELSGRSYARSLLAPLAQVLEYSLGEEGAIKSAFEDVLDNSPDNLRAQIMQYSGAKPQTVKDSLIQYYDGGVAEFARIASECAKPA